MKSNLVKEYLPPLRIVKRSENFTGEEILTKEGGGRLFLSEKQYACCAGKGYVILDFGRELCGGIRILSLYKAGAPRCLRIRLRFGESVGETCAEIGEKNATNDHSLRDFEIQIPCSSDQEWGQTGFRFVRIDFLDEEEYRLVGIFAAFSHRDLVFQGSFECNDPLVNKIYETARYTLFLNMQGGIWDGIKRDRLVWIGDMQPEVQAITDVFGKDESVEACIRESVLKNPLPCWFGNIPTYSFWFIRILYDYYLKTGNARFVREFLPYAEGILRQLDACVGEDGEIDYSGAGIDARSGFFLDWPTNGTPDAKAGNRFVFLYVLSSMKKLYAMLGEKPHPLCDALCERLSRKRETSVSAKQSVALGFLSGMIPAEEAADKLAVGGGQGLSTFMGAFILEALGKSRDAETALKIMKEYYGGMLSRGATSFWEDFDLRWLENSGRIDEPTPPGKKDLHGDFGNWCYRGFRHSLCHGWSCGPVQFLTEYILGIQVTEAGCRKISVCPHLGDLSWCKGTFPTPYGILSVSLEQKDGGIHADVSAPKEVSVTLAQTTAV